MAAPFERAFVALGSNLGDSPSIVQSALEGLAGIPGTQLIAQSSLHRTAPVGGPPDQSDYLNAVVELATTLAPHELLQHLQTIESRHGRDRTREQRWGPRRLDLDLLMVGQRVVDSPELELPHPRMEDRTFVLAPLAELCPDYLLPKCKQSVRDRCTALRAEVGA
ncbi:UNVERIFIED_CONTAM: hypothetical protein GTU68_042389 [Idotea baltica]|nr:hypothetical protein [Idotea baltica]